ncbi:hypothetical protein DY000_02030293 [Brassica cretica]|uniref:Uncharacterized protein n=1 Tax=Brassica cretica TaxID=69181 RepID=A0ABQ7DG87_BRACR|nr:hypothetical protein DY000_02030293 [Brassica cretica]
MPHFEGTLWNQYPGKEISVSSLIISKYQRYPSNWQANGNETKWQVNGTASNERNGKLMAMIFRLITRNFFTLLLCNLFYVQKESEKSSRILNFNRPSVLKESRKKEEAFRISSPLDCLPRFSRNNRKPKGEKTPTTEEEDRDTNLAAASENINPMDSVEEEEEEDENCVDTKLC